MDHRIPKVGTAISILLAIGALITFVFLNQRFEGPDPAGFLSSPYELTARFDNTKTLPTKQPVLHKGVSVGRVRSVTYDDEAEQGIVTFTLTDEIAPIYADAEMVIGERSLLGDAYLNLTDPGSPDEPELEAGDEVTNTKPSVNFDEALDFLDTEGRDRVRSLIGTIADGASPEGNDERLSGTVGGISRTIRELRKMTDALRGQEEQIAGLVSSSRIVLGELGSREAALRQIVAGGRTTLDALAVNTGSLEQAIEELPRLLAAGGEALGEIRPLLGEARPLLSSLRALAPDLVPAFEEGAPFAIGPLSRDLIAVIEGLGPMRRASEEVLPRATRFNRALLPVAIGARPSALNAVPIADYLAPRADSIAAFFALGTSVVGGGDEVGTYGRFGVNIDPGLLVDATNAGAFRADGSCPPSESFCFNAYPEPGDALDQQPFQPPYPRLEPFSPPPRESVIRD